jgi:phosphoribosylformimino-5-aminoimidazole carboxamide ribotide isomerase
LILYPAIDIRRGRAVRLVQGDYARETAFDTNPLDAARRWAGQGAEALHVVDLDGAREGRSANLEHLERICSEVSVPVQFGGGLRTAEAVSAALGAGASAVVLGTAALADPALVEALAHEHGERFIVAADARSGKVAVQGWERESQMSAGELVADLAGRGVRRFVYTPVEVDGTLAGPALGDLRKVAAAAGDAELIYSGGIGDLDHLRELARDAPPNLRGVIVGRALYEGRFDVAEGQAALRDG